MGTQHVEYLSCEFLYCILYETSLVIFRCTDKKYMKTAVFRNVFISKKRYNYITVKKNLLLISYT